MPTLRDLLPSYSELSPQMQLERTLHLRELRRTRVFVTKGAGKGKGKKLKPLTATKQQVNDICVASIAQVISTAFLTLAQLPPDVRAEVLRNMGYEEKDLPNERNAPCSNQNL